MRHTHLLRAGFAVSLALGALACGDAPAPGGDAEASTATPAAEEAPAVEAPAGLLNPNMATAEELAAAGLSSEVAQAVVAARPFATAAAFQSAVSQLAGEEATGIYESVWVPLDLNTATREEIMAIPGMTERMAGEFEEYRPYTSMDQFRTEIGKYVDEEEVARLERFVTIS